MITREEFYRARRQAAEMLALSPMGRNAKLAVELTSGRFSTAYTDELEKLILKEAASGNW